MQKIWGSLPSLPAGTDNLRAPACWGQKLLVFSVSEGVTEREAADFVSTQEMFEYWCAQKEKKFSQYWNREVAFLMPVRVRLGLE